MENFIFCAVNIWRVLRLFEKRNCSSYFFKVSFFSAELVEVIFAWRVLCYTAILSWRIWVNAASIVMECITSLCYCSEFTMRHFYYRHPSGIKKSNVTGLKVAYDCCLAVAHSLKINLIISGKFRERLKVTKTNSLRTNKITNTIFDW